MRATLTLSLLLMSICSGLEAQSIPTTADLDSHFVEPAERYSFDYFRGFKGTNTFDGQSVNQYRMSIFRFDHQTGIVHRCQFEVSVFSVSPPPQISSKCTIRLSHNPGFADITFSLGPERASSFPSVDSVPPGVDKPNSFEFGVDGLFMLNTTSGRIVGCVDLQNRDICKELSF